MFPRFSSFAFLLFGAAALAQTPSPSPAANDWTRVPGVDWERVKLESMGYSSARLEALRGWLKTQQTPAMLVAVHGKVDVNQTVKKLGLDDKQPFLPVEEHATLEMPMTARSGIYLPSGNDELDARTPKRGSEYPGTYFSYNNWDFNVLGTAFEKLTGKDIYDALDSELAKPVGMQDFDRAKQKKIPIAVSVHPEYAMSISTRDKARLGLLMARTPLQGAYSAMGAGGQFITVLPQADMVIAHKVDIDKDSSASVDPMSYDTILSMAIASRCPRQCQ